MFMMFNLTSKLVQMKEANFDHTRVIWTWHKMTFKNSKLREDRYVVIWLKLIPLVFLLSKRKSNEERILFL